jgi:hypothetical protein
VVPDISRHHSGLEISATEQPGMQHHFIEEWLLDVLSFFAQHFAFYFRDPEPQILDYRTQQYKLFPCLAASFAIRCAAIWLWNMYKDVVSELAGGDLERLPEVKCLSCLCAHCAEIKRHLLMFTLFGSLHIMAVGNVLLMFSRNLLPQSPGSYMLMRESVKFIYPYAGSPLDPWNREKEVVPSLGQ